MQKLLVGALLAVIVAVPGTGFAYDLSFRMVNNTNEPIVRVWTSPTTNPKFYEASNIYVPEDGQSQDIDFNDDVTGSDCYQDIMFQFQDGTRKTINHINLCAIRTIVIDVNSAGEVTYAASKN